MGKLFFNILATFAEFEADLIGHRTREGMAIARSLPPRVSEPTSVTLTQVSLHSFY